MVRTSIRILTALLIIGGWPAAPVARAQNAAATQPAPAKPDPVLAPIKDQPRLPRVLLIGDSISMGYTLPVRALLKGKANVHRPSENCGPTERGVEKLDAWLGDGSWNVIHFNFGLHDLKYVDADKQMAAPEQYEQNLRAIVKRLKRTGARLVWCSTTPVPAGATRPVRLTKDVLVYNAVAAKIMREEGIVVDDLYSFALPQLKSIQRRANVHYTDAGYKVLAGQVAKVILQTLNGELPPELDAHLPPSVPPVEYRVQLDTLHSGFDKQTCWVHARAGVIPGVDSVVVLTMQKLLLTGSDVYSHLSDMRSDDLGKTWTGPTLQDKTLDVRPEPDGVTVTACDLTPQWHAKSGKLLAIGHTVRYRNGRVIPKRAREIAYTVYDPAARIWSPWDTAEMPDAQKFHNAGSGSVQRYDLPDGDILLPIGFQGPDQRGWSTVLRCGFDGRKLTVRETGSDIHLDRYTEDTPRGLGEPSIARFRGKYYLTLRNSIGGSMCWENNGAFVCTSDDGLHYGPIQPWRFDDGADLGNYCTQQHWAVHADDGLFLVYTRRGAQNNHVFRHRAPLFMAQVDPEKLCVIRATERIVVPNHGARLGNFGVTAINAHETWVTVTEWMQTLPPDPHDYKVPMKYGADNAVFAARIIWDQPNRQAD